MVSCFKSVKRALLLNTRQQNVFKITVSIALKISIKKLKQNFAYYSKYLSRISYNFINAFVSRLTSLLRELLSAIDKLS